MGNEIKSGTLEIGRASLHRHNGYEERLFILYHVHNKASANRDQEGMPLIPHKP